VDAAGNVYVSDVVDSRVLKLAAGSSSQTVLPFTGLDEPRVVAVDAGGTVYVADTGNGRMLKLAAGSSTQIELDRPEGEPEEVAVDTTGTVYVSVNEISGLHSDSYLLSLAAGSHAWTRLPSAGVEQHVAADAAGDVYVTTSGDSEDVMRLAPGSAHWTEFPGLYLLKGPGGWRWTPAETCTSPAFWARAVWC
jgi:DNA-binding beta-propeller fold protein YncE